MDLGLSGKVALVAGASRGIGAATARRLAQEGARLVLAARNREGLEALALAGDAPVLVAADLTRTADAEAAVKAALDAHGRLDLMVVSVGAAKAGLFWELDDEVWTSAMDLKFMGMVRLLRAAAPVMKAQGSGSIVVVVGNNGRQPGARMGPGSAANAACLAVIKALADELAPHGVRVNAVNPGPTRTDRWDWLMATLAGASGRSIAEEEADQQARIPLGRINQPDEIADMIVFLGSARSGAMTGASVTVDGGATKAIA